VTAQLSIDLEISASRAVDAETPTHRDISCTDARGHEISDRPLMSLTDAEREAEFKRLGWLRYTRQLAAEQREVALGHGSERVAGDQHVDRGRQRRDDDHREDESTRHLSIVAAGGVETDGRKGP
jgi:hypothetical protein